MRYNVRVYEVHVVTYYGVEADSKQDAREIVGTWLEEGDGAGNPTIPEYSRTLDQDEWYIEEAE